MSIIELDSRYIIEMDQVTKTEWSDILQRFDDANIYQTWSYGAVRWGEKNLSHLVLKRDHEVVAMAQSRIVKFPGIKKGIAYVFRGPIWQLHRGERDQKILQYVIRAMREIYVVKRRLFLRIISNMIEEENNIFTHVIIDEGFRRKPSMVGDRTLILDLSPSIDELRKGPTRRWREGLRHAEKRGLNVIFGTSRDLYEIALNLYKEMHTRKKFVEFVDMNLFKIIQDDLPESLKIKIMVCQFQNEPAAAIAWSAIGNTGRALLAATGENGLETRASYLSWWKMMEWLKVNNFKYCDLGGINPDTNPGGYFFKTNFAGTNGKDEKYLGQFDSCESLTSRVLVGCVNELRFRWKKMRFFLNKIKNLNNLNTLKGITK